MLPTRPCPPRVCPELGQSARGPTRERGRCGASQGGSWGGPRVGGAPGATPAPDRRVPALRRQTVISCVF